MSFNFSQVAAPFRMQPGLRRVAPGTVQLTPMQPGDRHFEEKLVVLSAFPQQALTAAPGFDVLPVLAALASEAATSESPAFVQSAALDFAAPRLGWAVSDGAVRGEGAPAIGAVLRSLPRAQRAVALLCLAFQEDFAVIDGHGATIPWLAVCLPSRWAPEDKVGRHFAEVHAPVADNTLLVAAGEQLARLVSRVDRWERIVWTLSADPKLDQHPTRSSNRWSAEADADGVAATANFRHEYQTFIPLPGRGQAVFTIRVDSAPLSSVLRFSEDAMRLHAAIASMTPAVLAYRGLDAVRDRLLMWLAQRATTLPAAA